MSEEIREEIQETPVEQAEVITNEPQELQEEKPKSGYIDYNALPEDVRDTVKMRVDGDYRKLKGFEKKESEWQRERQEYEQKLAEINKPREVSPPTADDFYNDPDAAEQKLNAYNEFVGKQAEWNTQEKLKEQQHQEQIARQQAERQQAFMKRTESAGINEHELGYAASVAAPALGQDTQSYLMEHEYGPQILMQLAKNPVELQELASLSPYQVGVKLDKIAKAFKPTKVTKAPPPDDPIRGAGVDSSDDYPILKGAKFL